MTALGLLNFVVLQWFGVRLSRITREQYLCRTITVGWTLLRWIWPLTGWWSPYRWIGRGERLAITLQVVDRATRQIRRLRRALRKAGK